MRLTGAAVLALAACTSAFIATSSQRAACRQRSGCRTGSLSCSMSSPAVAGVETKDLALLFGRLAEKTLFMDGSAGACCHSGCDNCPFRYDFDVMNSGRPKWIPAYSLREFDDGRSHAAKWRALFHPAGATEPSPVTKEQFLERASELSFAMPLGPSGYYQPSEVPSEQALEALWRAVCGGGEQLSAEQFEAKVCEWSEDGHSVTWPAFERVLMQA